MKKIICALFCTAAGLLAVSCEVASLDEGKYESAKFMESVVITKANLPDSIPQGNITSTGDAEGPGDAVFPIKPPKKIN